MNYITNEKNECAFRCTKIDDAEEALVLGYLFMP